MEDGAPKFVETLGKVIEHDWLVVSIPLKNLSESVGIMKFPIEWKNNPHVPNQQFDNSGFTL